MDEDFRIKTFQTPSTIAPEFKLIESSEKVYWLCDLSKKIFATNVFTETTELVLKFHHAIISFCISDDESTIIFLSNIDKRIHFISYSLTTNAIRMHDVESFSISTFGFCVSNEHAYANCYDTEFSIFHINTWRRLFNFSLGPEHVLSNIDYRKTDKHNFVLRVSYAFFNLERMENAYMREVWCFLDWNRTLNSNSRTKTLAQDESILSCIFSDDGKRLFIAYTHKFEVYNVPALTLTNTIKHKNSLSPSKLNHSGRYIFGCTDDHQFFMTDLQFSVSYVFEKKYFSSIHVWKDAPRMIFSEHGGKISMYWIYKLHRQVLILILLDRHKNNDSLFKLLPLDVFKIISLKASLLDEVKTYSPLPQWE